MRQPLFPLSKTFREDDRKCPLQMPSTEQKEKASRRTAREDDILPYEDKTNRRAFFPASLREGGGPRSGGRSKRAHSKAWCIARYNCLSVTFGHCSMFSSSTASRSPFPAGEGMKIDLRKGAAANVKTICDSPLFSFHICLNATAPHPHTYTIISSPFAGAFWRSFCPLLQTGLRRRLYGQTARSFLFCLRPVLCFRANRPLPPGLRRGILLYLFCA